MSRCSSPETSEPRGSAGSAEIYAFRAPARKNSPGRRGPSLKRQTAPSFLLPRQRYPSGSARRRLRLPASLPSHFGVNRCASPRSQPGISVVGSAEISGLRPKRRNSSPSGRGKSLRTRTKLPNSPFQPRDSRGCAMLLTSDYEMKGEENGNKLSRRHSVAFASRSGKV